MLSRSTACCLAALTALATTALPSSRAQDSTQAASQYLPQSAVLHARLESLSALDRAFGSLRRYGTDEMREDLVDMTGTAFIEDRLQDLLVPAGRSGAGSLDMLPSAVDDIDAERPIYLSLLTLEPAESDYGLGTPPVPPLVWFAPLRADFTLADATPRTLRPGLHFAPTADGYIAVAANTQTMPALGGLEVTAELFDQGLVAFSIPDFTKAEVMSVAVRDMTDGYFRVAQAENDHEFDVDSAMGRLIRTELGTTHRVALEALEAISELRASLSFEHGLAAFDVELGLKPDNALTAYAQPERPLFEALLPALDAQAAYSQLVNLSRNDHLAKLTRAFRIDSLKQLSAEDDLGLAVPAAWADRTLALAEIAELLNRLDELGNVLQGASASTVGSLSGPLSEPLSFLRAMQPEISVLGLPIEELQARLDALFAAKAVERFGLTHEVVRQADSIVNRIGFDLNQHQRSGGLDPETWLDMGTEFETFLSEPFELRLDRVGEWTRVSTTELLEEQPVSPNFKRIQALLEDTPPLVIAHANVSRLVAPLMVFSGGFFSNQKYYTQMSIDKLDALRSPVGGYLGFDEQRILGGAFYDMRSLRDLSGLMESRPAVEATPERIAAFETRALPVFEAKCMRCHGAKRQRAGLRLDVLDDTLFGSNAQRVIEPGDPEASLLYQLIASPIDAEGHMPPDDKPQLTPEEVEAVRAWITDLPL